MTEQQGLGFFGDMRAALQRIAREIGDGYLVSCSWDGAIMRVVIAKKSCGYWPEKFPHPWVMTLDDEADYALEPDELIQFLIAGAKAWFGSN